jgi:chemotaxis signal transduction protein
MDSIRACFIQLGSYHFAFDGGVMKQIVEVKHVTPVPRTPASMLGLFAVQGTIYPLFDMLYPLELKPLETRMPLALLIQAQDRVVGVSVEKVLGFMVYRNESTSLAGESVRAFSSGAATSSALSAPLIDAHKLVGHLTRQLVETV